MQPWRRLEFGLYFNAKITRQKKNINDSNAAKKKTHGMQNRERWFKKKKKRKKKEEDTCLRSCLLAERKDGGLLRPDVSGT